MTNRTLTILARPRYVAPQVAFTPAAPSGISDRVSSTHLSDGPEFRLGDIPAHTLLPTVRTAVPAVAVVPMNGSRPRAWSPPV